MSDHKLTELTADLVAAYVTHNSVPAADLPRLLDKVHDALTNLGQAAPVVEVEAPPVPAVAIKKSVADDYIVCLDCGLHFKSLKRHIGAAHGLSPQEYRARWSLPKDYPMVPPAYAKARSDLAKSLGLGTARVPNLRAVGA